MRRMIVLLFLGMILTGKVHADSRSEFMFRLQTALKMRDHPGLAACFHFDRVEADTERQVWMALEQILSWQGHHVTVTERKKEGPFFMERDGRRFTLNGNWTFQVHIHQTEGPSRGFVFPCGETDEGKFAILLSVPAK